MRLIVNDISWQIEIHDKNEIVQSLSDFAELCKYVIRKSHNLDDKRIYSVQPVEAKQYCSFAKMKGYLKEIDDKECRDLIIGVINNSPTIEVKDESPMQLQGYQTFVFSIAQENDVLLSMNTTEWLRQDSLTGCDGFKQKTIKNIYSIAQSYVHKSTLGYRIYKMNPKHNHKGEIKRKKGMINSPMDLDDQTAQKVLDEAIPDEWTGDRKDLNSVSKYKSPKLYAKYEGKYYEFQGIDNIYHGYTTEKKELNFKCSAKLLNKLDKCE